MLLPHIQDVHFVALWLRSMKKKKKKKADCLRDKNRSCLATAPKHHISDSHGMEEVNSARRGREGAGKTPAGNLPPQDSIPAWYSH